jgi:hypothetical protein
MQVATQLKAKKALHKFNKHFFFSLNDTVSAMKFGRFGREDSAMVMITVTGGLTVKILKRTAQFEKMESALAPKVEQVISKFQGLGRKRSGLPGVKPIVNLSKMAF